MADSEVKKWKDTPFLSELTEEAWMQFTKLFRSYAARGGKSDVIKLIDPDLHDLIKLQMDSEDDFDASDEDKQTKLIDIINRFYSPVSKKQSIAKLKAIKYSVEGRCVERKLNKNMIPDVIYPFLLFFNINL